MLLESTYGAWIRRRRRSLLLTHADLAQQVACFVAAIRKFESGERRPSRDIAERLRRVLAMGEPLCDAFVSFARDGRDTFSLDGTPPAPPPP